MITPEMIVRYIHDPVRFTTEIIGAQPEQYQADIMMDVATKQMVSVKSGHGTGKTALASWLMLWFLFTRPHPRIPCTAPTEHQLKDILWSEVAKWLYASPLKDHYAWTNERVFLKSRPETWFAVARVASKGDALQGFHAEHLFFIIEEASGVSDKLFEPVLGALTEENAKLLLIGNPTQLSGFFYDSHNKNAAAYTRHTLNAELSQRVSPSAVKRIADLYGIDSDPYRVRVLGLFPKAMPDSFISMEHIDKGLVIDLTKLMPSAIHIGVDVARFGDDESVIQPVHERSGMYQQKPPQVFRKLDTMQLTGEIVNLIRSYNNNEDTRNLPVNIKVDIGGMGAGVVDRLAEIRALGALRFTLTEVNFGGRGGELESEPIPFANNTGLLWGRVRHMLGRNRLALIRDEVLISQLNNRKYRLNSEGEIILERKEDMKKRGAGSPDRADALSIALAPVEGSGIQVIDYLF